MDDIYSRFWSKYRLKTKAYGVSDADHKYYISCVKALIAACPDKRLIEFTPDDLYKYLAGIAGKLQFKDKQFLKLVDSVRILFSELVKPDWADEFLWDLNLSSFNSTAACGLTVDLGNATDVSGILNVRVSASEKSAVREAVLQHSVFLNAWL
ncbi:MAG: hypothetical protein OQK46_02360 [Gammaproteobacteria bacterium]|nr:hypothetical protein [Gammaproteobacteria bacterium]